jgi:hypothetical protein
LSFRVAISGLRLPVAGVRIRGRVDGWAQGALLADRAPINGESRGQSLDMAIKPGPGDFAASLEAFNRGVVGFRRPVPEFRRAAPAPTIIVAQQGRRAGDINRGGVHAMKKALPEKMFAEAEQSRLSALRTWVLDQGVTEIEMNEQQF